MINQDEDYSSPTNATKTTNTETSLKTPFSKEKFSSKSPKRSLLKKSKRRDCTPDSPPHSESKLILHTAGNDNSKDFRPVQLFPDGAPKLLRNTLTLELIEEHIDEVTDKYYDYLGKQSTPETLFNNLFTKKDSEDLKEKNNSIMPQLNMINEINSLVTHINSFQFSPLSRCSLCVISQESNAAIIDIEEFKSSFKRMEVSFGDLMLSSSSSEEGRLIVKGSVEFLNDTTCSARLILKKGRGPNDPIEIEVLELRA